MGKRLSAPDQRHDLDPVAVGEAAVGVARAGDEGEVHLDRAGPGPGRLEPGHELGDGSAGGALFRAAVDDDPDRGIGGHGAGKWYGPRRRGGKSV